MPKKDNRCIASMVRLKNRYLVVEFQTKSENTDSKWFLQAIRDSIQELFGDIVYGKILYSLAIKYWSTTGTFAILRTSRSQLKPVLATLTILPAKLSGKTTTEFTVVHVGGTLRTCKKFLLKKATADQKTKKKVEQIDTTAT